MRLFQRRAEVRPSLRVGSFSSQERTGRPTGYLRVGHRHSIAARPRNGVVQRLCGLMQTEHRRAQFNGRPIARWKIQHRACADVLACVHGLGAFFVGSVIALYETQRARLPAGDEVARGALDHRQSFVSGSYTFALLGPERYSSRPSRAEYGRDGADGLDPRGGDDPDLHGLRRKRCNDDGQALHAVTLA